MPSTWLISKSSSGQVCFQFEAINITCTWREGYSAEPSSIIILIIVSPCTLPYIIILSPYHQHHQVRRRGKPYSASWTRRSPQSLPPPPPQAPRPTGRPSATASSLFLRSGDKHLALILSLVRLSLSLEGFKPFFSWCTIAIIGEHRSKLSQRRFKHHLSSNQHFKKFNILLLTSC